MTSCLPKKEITTQVVDCIPSDSCTFYFNITETHKEIIDPVSFFTIALLPWQGIGGHTDFNGEYQLTLKRSFLEKNIYITYSYTMAVDTISIPINDCEEDYFLTYDLPIWLKDSLRVDYGKVIKFRSMPQQY